MTELGAYLLPAVPLLVLLVFLICGRYPGHVAIVRLAERLATRGRRRRAPLGASRPVRHPIFDAPRGGLLLAISLSGRAPPA